MDRNENRTIRVDALSAKAALSKVIARIDAAWREKRFEGLDDCFHPDAVIVGPDYAELARGREACIQSYAEFATNARVLAYTEFGHELRVWESTAVYTFAWEMTFQREQGPRHEKGSDQLVFHRGRGGWQVVWRFVDFEAVV